MSIVVWAIVLIIAVIVEIFTMQLVSIWFAVGALGSLISSFFVGTFTQCVVFVLVSLVLLIFTRPILNKIVVKNPQPTNHELDIGKTAIVIEAINKAEQTGRVSLNGVNWNAQSDDNSIIEKGSTVIVEEVEGTKLLVKKS